MFYAGRPTNFAGGDVVPIATGLIGLAKSTDGLNWEKVHAEGGPMGSCFAPLESDDSSFDAVHVAVGDVVQEDSSLRMWYFGGGQDAKSLGVGKEFRGVRMSIGQCISTDGGLSWSRGADGRNDATLIPTDGTQMFLGWPTVVHGRDGLPTLGSSAHLFYHARTSPTRVSSPSPARRCDVQRSWPTSLLSPRTSTCSAQARPASSTREASPPARSSRIRVTQGSVSWSTRRRAKRAAIQLGWRTPTMQGPHGREWVAAACLSRLRSQMPGMAEQWRALTWRSCPRMTSRRSRLVDEEVGDSRSHGSRANVLSGPLIGRQATGHRCGGERQWRLDRMAPSAAAGLELLRPRPRLELPGDPKAEGKASQFQISSGRTVLAAVPRRGRSGEIHF